MFCKECENLRLRAPELIQIARKILIVVKYGCPGLFNFFNTHSEPSPKSLRSFPWIRFNVSQMQSNIKLRMSTSSWSLSPRIFLVFRLWILWISKRSETVQSSYPMGISIHERDSLGGHELTLCWSIQKLRA